MIRQAHPKWRDDLRLVVEGIAFLLCVGMIVAAASLS